MSCPRLPVLGFVVVTCIACRSSDTGPHKDAGATGGATAGGAGGSGGSAAGGRGGSGGSAAGGAGGSGGNAAGGRGGSGGTGGSTSLDPTEVCRTAVRIQAEQIVRCMGYSTLDALMRFATACPEYAFNPDSNRTVEDIAACLPSLAARTCTDVTLSIMPTCFANGRRDSGAGCAFSSQCKSGLCIGGGKQCGECYDGAKPAGSACLVYYECDAGSYCSRGSQTCVDHRTVVYAAEGQPCDLTTVPAVGCVGNLYCQLTGGGSAGKCLPLPGVDQPCGSNGFNSTICADGTTCADVGVCRLPGACGNDQKCDPASYCSYSSSSLGCKPRASVGQACGSPGSSAPLCLAPAVCGDQGTCVVPRAVGEACNTANPCADYFLCVSGTCQSMVADSCPA